jgi:hypothetical protein
MPYEPSLLGARLDTQLQVLDPQFNQLGVRLSQVQTQHVVLGWTQLGGGATMYSYLDAAPINSFMARFLTQPLAFWTHLTGRVPVLKIN